MIVGQWKVGGRGWGGGGDRRGREKEGKGEGSRSMSFGCFLKTKQMYLKLFSTNSRI